MKNPKAKLTKLVQQDGLIIQLECHKAQKTNMLLGSATTFDNLEGKDSVCHWRENLLC